MEITSNLFFEKWIKVVNERNVLLKEIWRQNTDFTYQIIKEENSILIQIASELELKCYNQDYYCLDAVFYKPEDRVPGIPENHYWLHNFRIAFEHENNFNSGLYKEVSHLLITNCELKVLVTYPNGETETQLKYLHQVISANKHKDQISSSENFLMIFGYESNFEWEGYIYKTEGWKRIRPAFREDFIVISHEVK